MFKSRRELVYGLEKKVFAISQRDDSYNTLCSLLADRLFKSDCSEITVHWDEQNYDTEICEQKNRLKILRNKKFPIFFLISVHSNHSALTFQESIG